jgi:TonB family protein
MTLLSDARGTPSLFDSYDGYIEQIQQVLRANHVPFGTPFDFLILAQTLENNSQLRNDLAVLLQSFMDGKDKITHRIALGIIAVASGGPDFTTSSDGISPQAGGMGQPAANGNQQINVLVDLLMSVGGRTLTTPQNSGSHFNGHRQEPIDDQTHQAALLAPYSFDQESDTEQFADSHSDDSSALEAAPGPSSPDSNQDSPQQDSPPQDSSARSVTEDPLVESLTRLELNALQVKHYLDSIDQRISRIEPRLDSLPAYVPPPTAPHPISESHPGFGFGHVTDGRYSAMLATETPPHQTQDEPPPLDPPRIETAIPSEMSSLLKSSSRQKHSQKKFEIPIITGAALVLLVLLYWGFNQNTQSPRIDPENPSLAQNTPIPPSNSASANHATPSRPSEGATARPSPSHIAAAEALSEVHHRPLRSSKHADLNASSPSSAPTTPATSADPERSDDSTVDLQPINVSSGVMAGNVLSAPQPSYPLLASLTRMRGEVVMQAIISKEGTIENVHVIKGHRLLRGAATHAVRSWRYRPYLVNGRPVEVATTVSVDFNQAAQ